MKWEITYSRQARQDLRDIYEYIAYGLLDPESAKRQVRRIGEEIDTLDAMPFRYPLFDREPWRGQGLRVFSVNSYLVFYWPDEAVQRVTVARVMYGGRDLRRPLMEPW